jgi:hypothetical protein
MKTPKVNELISSLEDHKESGRYVPYGQIELLEELKLMKILVKEYHDSKKIILCKSNNAPINIEDDLRYCHEVIVEPCIPKEKLESYCLTMIWAVINEDRKEKLMLDFNEMNEIESILEDYHNSKLIAISDGTCSGCLTKGHVQIDTYCGKCSANNSLEVKRIER